MTHAPTDLPTRSATHLEDVAPVILAFDTSSRLTSIAAARGQELIFSFGALLDDNRSARLWSLIDFLLAETGLRLSDVDLFAVCVGPGGFTGLRVGITAAKGFAEAMNKPLVGVTSLEAQAAAATTTALKGAGGAAPLVYVLNNAYKNEVYSQLFSFDGDGVPVTENEPTVGDLQTALERIATRDAVIVTGDAVSSNPEEIQLLLDATSHSAVVAPTAGQQLLAPYIARIAYFRYKDGSTVPPADLQACYVRGADIKIKQQG